MPIGSAARPLRPGYDGCVPRLNTGDAAPAFQVADPDGRPVRSEDLRGTRTVLYFFPKANTAG